MCIPKWYTHFCPFWSGRAVFELPCLFYKHLAQKDVYVVRTLTLFLLADYVIPVSLWSHLSLSDSIYRPYRKLFRVYHEPSVKTVQHKILCCSMIITFSKPTQLRQFIHKGGFVWKVSDCLPAACELSPGLVKQETLQLNIQLFQTPTASIVTSEITYRWMQDGHILKFLAYSWWMV